MKISVNDRIVELDAPISVTTLVESEGIGAPGTAVAVNNKIVRRGEWEGYLLSDGDQVVIIKAAYGG